jgi:hypothetical protein
MIQNNGATLVFEGRDLFALVEQADAKGVRELLRDKPGRAQLLRRDDVFKRTPLAVAMCHGPAYEPIVKDLLEHGAVSTVCLFMHICLYIHVQVIYCISM